MRFLPSFFITNYHFRIEPQVQVPVKQQNTDVDGGTRTERQEQGDDTKGVGEKAEILYFLNLIPSYHKWSSFSTEESLL